MTLNDVFCLFYLLRRQIVALLAIIPCASAKAEHCSSSFKEITSVVSNKLVEQVYRSAATNLIALKCVRYNLENPQPLACAGAAAETVRALDCKAMNIHDCFDSEYAKMIETSDATDYFNLLSEGMKKAIEQGQKFDLWNTTLNFFKGNKTEALKWLAVMFHERFTSRITNCYITTDGVFHPQKSRPPCSGPNHILHTRVGDLLNELADKRPNLISLYPIAGVPRGAGWYHFYMPAYLTANLIEKGYSPELSSYMQTELNASYEYRYFNPKASAMDHQGDIFGYSELKEKLYIFVNSFPPRSIDRNLPAPKTDDYFENRKYQADQSGIRHGLNATYMGYSATQWVIQNQSPLSKEQFSDRFSAGPDKFFRDMLLSK